MENKATSAPLHSLVGRDVKTKRAILREQRKEDKARRRRNRQYSESKRQSETRLKEANRRAENEMIRQRRIESLSAQFGILTSLVSIAVCSERESRKPNAKNQVADK
jgi:DNA-binding helix-hairpin-helix protein with protein kinase domain